MIRLQRERLLEGLDVLALSITHPELNTGMQEKFVYNMQFNGRQITGHRQCGEKASHAQLASSRWQLNR